MSVDKTVDAIRNFSTNPEEVTRTALKEISGASEYEGMRRGAFESNVIGAKRRFTEAGQAGMQLMTMGFEAAGSIPEGATADYTRKIAEEAAAFAKTPYANSGGLGAVIADVAMALPLIAISGPTALTLRGAAAIGAFEGLTRPAYSQDDVNLLNPERLTNVAFSTLAAVGGSYLTTTLAPAVTATIQQKMARAPFSIAQNKGVGALQREAVVEANDAAKKFNTFVTPAEASRDTLQMQVETDLKLFGKPKQKLFEKVQKREEVLQSEINTIVKGLTPEGSDAARTTASAFSQTAYAKSFPLVAEFAAESPLLQSAYKAVSGDARKELIRRSGGGIDIKPNTIGELHLMRLHLDDMISFAKRSGASIAELSATRRNLLAMADTFAPEYAIARNMSQRLILQDKIIGTLDTAKKNDPRGTTSSFYQTYLETPAKTQDFLKEVNNITDKAVRDNVIENIKAIEPVLRAVHKSPLDDALGLSTRAVEFRAAGMGGPKGVLINLVTNVTDGLLDNRVSQFITSPSWINKFNKTTKNASPAARNRAFFNLFYEYLGKTAPAIAASIQRGKFTGETEQQQTVTQ
tara:strand:+ start:1272 stop:3005 length:1734 start_codon:yes stop_codon:yes gene_type:complete